MPSKPSNKKKNKSKKYTYKVTGGNSLRYVSIKEPEYLKEPQYLKEPEQIVPQEYDIESLQASFYPDFEKFYDDKESFIINFSILAKIIMKLFSEFFEKNKNIQEFIEKLNENETLLEIIAYFLLYHIQNEKINDILDIDLSSISLSTIEHDLLFILYKITDFIDFGKMTSGSVENDLLESVIEVFSNRDKLKQNEDDYVKSSKNYELLENEEYKEFESKNMSEIYTEVEKYEKSVGDMERDLKDKLEKFKENVDDRIFLELQDFSRKYCNQFVKVNSCRKTLSTRGLNLDKCIFSPPSVLFEQGKITCTFSTNQKSEDDQEILLEACRLLRHEGLLAELILQHSNINVSEIETVKGEIGSCRELYYSVVSSRYKDACRSSIKTILQTLSQPKNTFRSFISTTKEYYTLKEKLDKIIGVLKIYHRFINVKNGIPNRIPYIIKNALRRTIYEKYLNSVNRIEMIQQKRGGKSKRYGKSTLRLRKLTRSRKNQ